MIKAPMPTLATSLAALVLCLTLALALAPQASAVCPNAEKTEEMMDLFSELLGENVKSKVKLADADKQGAEELKALRSAEAKALLGARNDAWGWQESLDQEPAKVDSQCQACRYPLDETGYEVGCWSEGVYYPLGTASYDQGGQLIESTRYSWSPMDHGTFGDLAATAREGELPRSTAPTWLEASAARLADEMTEYISWRLQGEMPKTDVPTNMEASAARLADEMTEYYISISSNQGAATPPTAGTGPNPMGMIGPLYSKDIGYGMQEIGFVSFGKNVALGWVMMDDDGNVLAAASSLQDSFIGLSDEDVATYVQRNGLPPAQAKEGS